MVEREIHVLACIPTYGDRGRGFCFDPAGPQESAQEFGLGCASRFAIRLAPELESPGVLGCGQPKFVKERAIPLSGCIKQTVERDHFDVRFIIRVVSKVSELIASDL
jgi:hypothetical protein